VVTKQMRGYITLHGVVRLASRQKACPAASTVCTHCRWSNHRNEHAHLANAVANTAQRSKNVKRVQRAMLGTISVQARKQHGKGVYRPQSCVSSVLLSFSYSFIHHGQRYIIHLPLASVW
jgi:hypothetical protein